MKIIFINANIKEDYSSLDVAITLLATIINKNSDHEAFILDTTFHPDNWKKYLKNRINKIKPDMFAFSCNNLYMRFVDKITDFLKATYPEIPIIGGGYYPSVYPEEAIRRKNFSGMLLGDGESKIVEILDRFQEERKIPEDIPGFWVKKKDRIIRNGKGTFCKDISDFPFLDWDLWEDLDKYLYFLQMIYFVGSRGCPYHCSFCEACEIADNIEGTYFRKIKPEKFAQELAYQWKKYKSRGMKLAQLFDPVFTIDLEWMKRFSKEYNRLLDPKKHPISVFSRIDNLDEEKIKVLADAGCKIVRMGIESGDEFIRNKVHEKKISTEQIIAINDLLRKNKIVQTNYYILGAPGESKKTMEKTIDLALKLNASRTAFFIYKPITKKSLEIIRKFDNSIDRHKLRRANNLQYGAVIRLKDASPFTIELLQKKAYLFFLTKKISGMIAEQKLNYFIRMIIYLSRGLRCGLRLKYLIPYYHIYGYENITK